MNTSGISTCCSTKSFLVTLCCRHPGLRHHRHAGRAAAGSATALDDRLKSVAERREELRASAITPR